MGLLPEGHPHKVCKDFDGTLVIQKHSDVKLEARSDGGLSMSSFSKNIVLVIELDDYEKAALVDHLCGLPINPPFAVEAVGKVGGEV